MNALVKKRSLGQYFTVKNFWLKEHIIDFILSTKTSIAVDPFAGNGDLLKCMENIGYKKLIGLDIDSNLNWETNDSLINIPRIKNSIIVTNPPYLTNYSAKRKGIYENVKKYFNISKYEDLYQIALDKCLKNDFGVLIIPETFLNSSFPKNRLVSITIIEENLFGDTEVPVCVVCFDNKIKTLDKVKVFKNNLFLNNLQYFESMRMTPLNNMTIRFNAPGGCIALRAVDTTNPGKLISFMKKEDIDYDLTKIKNSSRLITLIDVKIDNNQELEKIIEKSNLILNNFRKKSFDILLSPFKGNKKNGERRRRLDYLTARSIIENAYLDNNIKINKLF